VDMVMSHDPSRQRGRRVASASGGARPRGWEKIARARVARETEARETGRDASRAIVVDLARATRDEAIDRGRRCARVEFERW